MIYRAGLRVKTIIVRKQSSFAMDSKWERDYIVRHQAIRVYVNVFELRNPWLRDTRATAQWMTQGSVNMALRYE